MQQITRNNVIRLAGLWLLGICAVLFLAGVFHDRVGAQTQTAPKFKVDLSWPKPLPNKWKMGGVTGLAVDKDDNVWVYDRPNDLTTIEIEADGEHLVAKVISVFDAEEDPDMFYDLISTNKPERYIRREENVGYSIPLAQMASVKAATGK